MKQNLNNSGNGANRLMSQLAAEKKKTVMALCLIAVMVFMWVKLLGKKTPETAEAAMRQDEAMREQSNSQLKISFIELPKVPGRNDVLTRDFFASGRWQDFIGGGTKEANVVSGDGSEEVVRRVAEKLRLEAIGLGGNPQAFINDKLLSVGDKLLIRDGVKTFECEVTVIEENAVFIRCGEAEIKLKLTETIENRG